jgi:hypothetical protein
MEFLESLSGISDLQGSIKEIKSSLDNLNLNVEAVESDYFIKA